MVFKHRPGSGAAGVPANVAWSTAWDTASAAGKAMPQQAVAANLVLTRDDTGSVLNGYTTAPLAVSGAGLTVTVDGTALPLTQGLTYVLTLKNVAGAALWMLRRDVNAGTIVMAVPPAWASAPVLASAMSGTAASYSGTASGSPAPSYSYQWTLNGVAIGGATAATYTPIAGNVGGALRVVVTASNSAGSAVGTSNAVTVAASAVAALSSFALVGDSLTQFGSGYLGLNAVTLTRDAAGTVTLTKAGHGIYGPASPVYMLNCIDASFEGEYIATSVDANTLSLAGGVAGAAGTTTTTSLGGLIQTNRNGRRGYWQWLNSARNGGLVCKGTFGQGGDSAAQMVQATTQALAKNPDAVIIAAGINDVYSLNYAPSVAWANIKALIDQVNAAGKVAVVCSVTPVSSGNAGYSAQNVADHIAVDNEIQAYCAASPSNRINVDARTPLFDSAGQQAYSWAVYDTIHWTTRGAKAVGDAIAAVLAAATAQAPTLLPVSAADAAVVNGYTSHIRRGPWVATAGGTFGAGMSGSAPSGWSWTRSGAGVGVCSIVDPGDGKGLAAQVVFTPGTTNEDMVCWPWTNTAPTLAALGLTAADTIVLSCEVEWSGAIAANLGTLELKVESRTAASPFVTYALATDGEVLETAAGRWPDADTQVFSTGPLKLDANAATFPMSLRARFFAASASAFTMRVRRVNIRKA